MLKDSLLPIIMKYYSNFVRSLIAFEYCSLSWIHQQSTVDTAGGHWTFSYMYIITVNSQGHWQNDRGLGSGLWAIPGHVPVMVCETQGSKQTVTHVTKCSLPATQYVLKPLWSRRNYKLCKPHYIYGEMKERGRAVNLFKQIEKTQWLLKKKNTTKTCQRERWKEWENCKVTQRKALM